MYVIAYLDAESLGSEVVDMISFLAGCPESCRKSNVFTLFRLRCLCLQHLVLDLSEVSFESAGRTRERPDLSKMIKAVQNIYYVVIWNVFFLSKQARYGIA